MTEEPTRSPGPGLAKTRAALIRRRRVELFAALDGPLRDLLHSADIMSEGMCREEDGALIYYGTTSVLFTPRSLTGASIPELAALMQRDPHLRLRALRLSHREAEVRAPATIGPVRAEMSVFLHARGVTLVVDVVAKVTSRAAARSRSNPP
jgi:hypothetical protein